MTARDVDKILDVLSDLRRDVAVLQEKVNQGVDDAKRIRRLELIVVAQTALLAALFGKAAGLNLPGLN